MPFKTAMLKSYVYGYPFSKNAGRKYIVNSLENVICGNSVLDSDIVNVLGNKRFNESDKEYAVKMYNSLN